MEVVVGVVVEAAAATAKASGSIQRSLGRLMDSSPAEVVEEEAAVEAVEGGTPYEDPVPADRRNCIGGEAESRGMEEAFVEAEDRTTR